MKTNMKMTEAQQAAVNEIARNAFIADRFGKIKGPSAGVGSTGRRKSVLPARPLSV